MLKTLPEYKRPRYIDKVIRSVSFRETDGTSIDERIKKIDTAKDNLQDAIRAVDELRNQANANKQELEDALRRIEIVEAQKYELSSQLTVLKQLAEADTDAFRRIVGIPTKADVWRERLLGFASGVLASILASVIFLLVIKTFKIS